MINVLIVDDHDLIRAGMRHMLSNASGIKVVGEAANGEEATKIVRNLAPDVILMDINMPGIGGLEATRKILRSSPNTKILIITAYDDDMHPSRLLQFGATGYITKNASMEEMLHAIKCVYSGQRYVSSSIAQQLVLKRMDNIDHAPFDELSGRELQVALMIVKGVKTKDIAEKLNLSIKTVSSYRYRIFNKLKIKGDVDLVRLAMQHDLVEH